jgi:hypothetical protein
MRGQNSNPRQTFVCPTSDQSLFSGSFSGRLRELAMGSSRSDALAAIRKSQLKDWVVDNSGATLEIDGTKLAFQRLHSSDMPWVIGETPHGRFLLFADHWIAQQLLRRLDRRTHGFGLQLRSIATDMLHRLDIEASQGMVRSWNIDTQKTFPARPMQPTRSDPYYGTRNSVVRVVADTKLDQGLYAELLNLTYFGTRTQEEAHSDYIDYKRDTRRASEPWCVPRPMPGGSYVDTFLTISVYSEALDQLRNALGLERDSLDNARDGSPYSTVDVGRIWAISGVAKDYFPPHLLSMAG